MSTPPLIFVLNGPNLNLLGQREPDVYGKDTLDDIAAAMTARAEELGLTLDIRQSNHVGHLIDWLHEAHSAGARAVIFNPGGYTHSSVACARGGGHRGAVIAAICPTAARETFRSR